MGRPGRDGSAAGPIRQHDDADPNQHGEDRDELPVGEYRCGEPHPPVDAPEITVCCRIPAREAGEREELDVNGEHTEHAYSPEHVERSDPRRPLVRRSDQRFGALRSRRNIRGRRLVIHA